jgi:hypothetical protein
MSRARHHTAKKGGKHRETGGEVKEGNPAIYKLADEKRSIGVIKGDHAPKRLDRKAKASPYSSAHKSGGKA